MNASRPVVARRALLLAGAALLLAAPLAAQGSSLGALAPYLLIGSDPPWTGAEDGTGYRLTNATRDGNVIYFVAALPGGSASEIAVEVAVQGGAGANYAGAGLIFNFDPRSRDYLALVLVPADELLVYRRDAQGLNQLTSLPLTGIAAGGPVTLALKAGAEGVAIEANGVRQGSFQGLALSGQAGILAIDGGSFRFANYVVR